MKNIAVFASGSGTNAENLIRFFRTKPGKQVSLVLSNKREAGVLQRAENLNVQTFVFDRTNLYDSEEVLDILRTHKIDFIALAGFLWLIPASLIRAYPGRIVNIHPALLPGYGGKGMYGKRVHQAVIENGESRSGITIHYVNEKYDNGDVIFQATCEVKETDTPESLAERIHRLEYAHYPEVIDELLDRI